MTGMGTLLRRGAGFILLAGIITWTLLSALTTHGQVCEDVTAHVGTYALAHSCRAVTLHDPAVLAALIAMILLWLPDVANLRTGKLTDIERVLDELRQTADETAAKIDALRLEISESNSSAPVTTSLPAPDQAVSPPHHGQPPPLPGAQSAGGGDT
jgi:hypothetical protein